VLDQLGRALQRLDRHAEAVDRYAQALRAQPRDPEDGDALLNLASALRDTLRHAQALAVYERAMALDSAPAGVRWNRSLCLLAAGDFERGWVDYALRSKDLRLGNAERELEAPLWRGTQPLAGKTLLLHAEQGLGDTLQFCRDAAVVSALGARVALEVRPALKGVLGSLAGVHALIGRGEPLPPHDLHCPLLSLPLVLDTRLARIPAQVPYLHADPALLAKT
jgi:tetratricopeptide (TPR) repeat protein